MSTTDPEDRTPADQALGEFVTKVTADIAQRHADIFQKLMKNAAANDLFSTIERVTAQAEAAASGAVSAETIAAFDRAVAPAVEAARAAERQFADLAHQPYAGWSSLLQAHFAAVVAPAVRASAAHVKVAVSADLALSGQFAAEVSVVGEQTDTPAAPLQKISRNETLLLLVTLLTLKDSLLKTVREGDQLDQGLTLLVVAIVITVHALSMTP